MRDQRVLVDLERVVAEVEALELGSERRRGTFGLTVADLLDALDRLSLLLPQLARLSAFTVGQGDHLGGAALGGADGHGATGPPHEVGGVSTDDQAAAERS